MEELSFIVKTIKIAYKKFILNQKKDIKIKSNTAFLNDLVTSCDENVEKYISSCIKQKYPDDFIIGEEYNNLNELKGRCWVIDPIDGTVNFSRDIPIWCIQVAFVESNKTKCACIYIPTTKEIYTADETGSYLNGKLIKINANIDMKNSIINICDFYQDKNIVNFQLNIMRHFYNKVMKIKMFGSGGYEFAQVTSSKIQSFVIISNNYWDFLPGEFICQMAGANVIHSICANQKVTIVSNSKKLNDEYMHLIKDKN